MVHNARSANYFFIADLVFFVTGDMNTDGRLLRRTLRGSVILLNKNVAPTGLLARYLVNPCYQNVARWGCYLKDKKQSECSLPDFPSFFRHFS